MCLAHKRSVTVNLKSQAGQETVRRLAGVSDVLVENFRTGVLNKEVATLRERQVI